MTKSRTNPEANKMSAVSESQYLLTLCSTVLQKQQLFKDTVRRLSPTDCIPWWGHGQQNTHDQDQSQGYSHTQLSRSRLKPSQKIGLKAKTKPNSSLNIIWSIDVKSPDMTCLGPLYMNRFKWHYHKNSCEGTVQILHLVTAVKFKGGWIKYLSQFTRTTQSEFWSQAGK